jgi:hypothetical protein
MSMKILILILLFPLTSFSQNSNCSYFDANQVLYRRTIISNGEQRDLFYDTNEDEIRNVCDDFHLEVPRGKRDTVFREISYKLRKDTTQRIRNIKFSFIIDSQGIQNVRILQYQANAYSPSEIVGIVQTALGKYSWNSDCKKVVELFFLEYVDYPYRIEKKSLADMEEEEFSKQDKGDLNRYRRKRNRYLRNCTPTSTPAQQSPRKN